MITKNEQLRVDLFMQALQYGYSLQQAHFLSAALMTIFDAAITGMSLVIDQRLRELLGEETTTQ